MDAGLLPEYYVNCFPGQEICDWLSYGNVPESSDPNLDPDFLLKREFSFTLPGDIYCRHKSFRTWAAMREELKAAGPEKIDAGAVWSFSPSSKGAISGRYEPLERELVFDIDMNDYDAVRTCCVGATLCPRCWRYMCVACKSLRFILQESFGYHNLLWVFSGRRGIHCWVCDPGARRLNNSKRNDIINYINSGPKKQFPFLDIHNTLLSPVFEEICVDENGQNLFVREEQITKIRECIGEELADVVNSAPRRDSMSTWIHIRNSIRSRTESESFLEKMMKISFTYMFPKLDVNVSTRMDHLLKLPFSIHPKTGKVCVPFDPEEIDRFNPNTVPTLDQVTADPEKLKPYIALLAAVAEIAANESKAERSLRIKRKRLIAEHNLTF